MTSIDFTESECLSGYLDIPKHPQTPDYTLLTRGKRFSVYKAETLKGCCILGYGMDTCLTSLSFSDPVNVAYDKFSPIEDFLFILDNSNLPPLGTDFSNHYYICLGKTYYEMYDKDNVPTNLNTILDDDLKNFFISDSGLFSVLGKYMEPLALNSTYSDDVKFDFYNVRELPRRMTFYGKVSFTATMIESLPEELYCEDDLVLRYTSVQSLPETLYLGRNLDIKHSLFKSLPNKLRIRNNLNISETKIKTLPEGLYVQDNLNLRLCGITSLPEIFYCGGTIYGFSGRFDEYPYFHFSN